MTNDHPSHSRPDPKPGKPACGKCGRTQNCPPELLVVYIRTRNYPECCGEGMAFYVPAGKP